MLPGIKSWFNFLKFWWFFFSIPLLLKTLFAPWRRDITQYPRGFSFKEYATVFTFNLLSRLIGAFLRLITIVFGLLLEMLFIILLPVFILLPWQIKYSSLVKAGSIGKQWSYAYTPFLDQCSHALHQGPEIKLFGRQDEIAQIERVLARSKQDNILLIGQPGIGRETVLRGFAQKLSWGLSLPQLNNRRVLALNIEALDKASLQKALNQAARAGNIILVIEDFHRYANLSEIFRPYLEADELQIIGITDYNGLHYQLKPLPGLLKLFEKVEVNEPTDKEVILMLKAETTKNKIKANDKILEEIVQKTNQYVQNMPQPEKALDLLEELSVNKKEIRLADVWQILSEKTKIPIGEIAKEEKEKLLNLEEILHQRIINQEEAVRVIAQAMRRARAGVTSFKKPIGAFLFLGPTGVGKTETSKALAAAYFGSDDKMIRFDLSEFQEITAIDRLLDRLIKTIEENPFTLLLLDEIEKAHPDILHLFLPVLDEGILTSASGRKVSFRNAIIIGTSNAGAELIRNNLDIPKKELLDYLQKQNIFKPEFLNRFDAIVLFKPLSREHLQKIAELMLMKLDAKLKQEQDISLAITSELVDKIAVLGYEPEFGARPMARIIQDKVENQIAEKILRGQIKKGEQIKVVI